MSARRRPDCECNREGLKNEKDMLLRAKTNLDNALTIIKAMRGMSATQMQVSMVLSDVEFRLDGIDGHLKEVGE